MIGKLIKKIKRKLIEREIAVLEFRMMDVDLRLRILREKLRD